MVTDPSDLSDEEQKDYLREVFHYTEELNATAIHVHVKNDVVHLTGDVPSEEQRALAELLVLDLVPEDKLINDLVVVPEMSDETPPRQRSGEPLIEIGDDTTQVEHDDPDEAAQEGKPYEPPFAPTPEPKHEGEW